MSAAKSPTHRSRLHTESILDLVAKRALVREGERRDARYHLSVPLQPVPHVVLTEQGEITAEGRLGSNP
jgi:hypothetical protein